MLREVESVNMGCTLALKQQFQEICNVNAGIAEKKSQAPSSAPFSYNGQMPVLPNFQREIIVQKAKNYRFWTKIIVF